MSIDAAEITPSSAQAVAEESNQWVELAQIELQPSSVMIGSIRMQGFPALSKDGSELAILRHDDGMNYSASVVILRRSDHATLQRFELLDEARGGANRDAASIAKLTADVAPINAYLASKSFAPMAPLYTLPADRYPPPVQEFVSAGWRFTFDRQSSALTMHALDEVVEVLRLQQPRLVQPAADLNSENACFLDAVPAQGWIDVESKVVVARIDYVSSKDGCYESEDWVLKTIP